MLQHTISYKDNLLFLVKKQAELINDEELFNIWIYGEHVNTKGTIRRKKLLAVVVPIVAVPILALLKVIGKWFEY